VLSIIMPVFNEKAYVGTTLNQLLNKVVPGVDMEIIVVESNSTDGTRDVVREYEGRPGVRLILEERPQGKGHAVRAGLREASGDIVLIQDADCEYDFDDYEDLLKPLLKYRTAFVLGSRHTGTWKLRNFDAEPGLVSFLNFGHLLFVFLLNTMFGQALKDPFTMYKVFRRDCLHGLRLECDRFDFDFELVIKLIRKGYTPIEIPVNYTARSWAAGKKVRPFRDPLTWMRALVKYRFASIAEP
jgi:glycosyltransferase involved in cell wall biosynthesis